MTDLVFTFIFLVPPASNLVMCPQQATRLPLLLPFPDQALLLLLQLLLLLLQETHGFQQVSALLLGLLDTLRDTSGENTTVNFVLKMYTL